MAKHVLVTGFEPFGDFKVNPSELIVRGFEARIIAGRPVVAKVLPVESRSLRDRLRALLVEVRPDVVVGLGLAEGACALALERVALNVLDFKSPDNLGTLRRDEPIDPAGPVARAATLPLEAIRQAWQELGIPGYISNSAGTLVCNQYLYELLAATSEMIPPVAAGFVHLPCLPGMAVERGPAQTASMTRDLMARGIESLLETAIAWSAAPRNEPRPAAAAAGGMTWIPRGLKST